MPAAAGAGAGGGGGKGQKAPGGVKGTAGPAALAAACPGGGVCGGVGTRALAFALGSGLAFCRTSLLCLGAMSDALTCTALT